MYPCTRGSWLQAPPRPGWTARRARRAWHSPRSSPTTGGEARARPTPRQAGPAAGHELSSRAHELSSKGVELLPKAGQPQPPPRAGARRAPSAPGRPRDGPTSAEAKPRRGGGRRREPAHVSSARCGRSAGARKGAGPLVRRRRAVATSRQPRSQRALSVQTRDQLQGSIARAGLVCCIARLNGGARLREAAQPAHQPSRRSRTLKKAAAMSGERPSELALARHGGLLCRSRRARPRPGARGQILMLAGGILHAHGETYAATLAIVCRVTRPRAQRGSEQARGS